VTCIQVPYIEDANPPFRNRHRRAWNRSPELLSQSQQQFDAHDPKRIAEAYIAQLNKAKNFASPIVTRVDPFKDFFVAETEHQIS
jgi:Peptide methionine sulfoxide reductase